VIKSRKLKAIKGRGQVLGETVGLAESQGAELAEEVVDQDFFRQIQSLRQTFCPSEALN